MPSKAARFQIDIPGFLKVLKNAVYANPEVAVRELIQNAYDATSRRRQIDLDYSGRIDLDFDPDGGTLTVTDDGIGLSLDDAKVFLSQIGNGIAGQLTRLLPKSSKETRPEGDRNKLVGRFGLGVLSYFLIAEKVQIVSGPLGQDRSILWQADKDGNIRIEERDEVQDKTSVTLQLQPAFSESLQNEGKLEEIVRAYSDFLPCPIHIDGSEVRSNVIRASWYDGSETLDTIAMELESYFGETPLEVVPINIPYPPVKGTLYVTPQRTPGFSEKPSVCLTVNRMTVGREVEGILPNWTPFLRGILETPHLKPNLSREDVVRDEIFLKTKLAIDHFVLDYFHQMIATRPQAFQAIIAWHRYWIAGAAIDSPQLRSLLHGTYQFTTTKGPMTFIQLIEQVDANAGVGGEGEKTIWYNRERKRQRWMDDLFQDLQIPCIHALASFEEELLSTMIADLDELEVQLKTATPSSNEFVNTVLGAEDLKPVEIDWQDFLGGEETRILSATCKHSLPLMTFLDDRLDSIETFGNLEENQVIPDGFRRILKNHFQQMPEGQNEVILNLGHPFVKSTLASDVTNPKAAVLRTLISSSLQSAGHQLSPFYQQAFQQDLDWINQTFGSDQSSE